MEDFTERKRVIENWMLAVSTDGGLERHDDLHVDQIDAAWGSRKMWLDGGFEALRTAQELRALHHLDLVVVLVFSLTEAAVYPFKTLREVEAALDWSPPSLYLFRHGEEPWRQPGYARIEQLDRSVFSSAALSTSAFYVEFWQQDAGELCRSIYIAA